MSDEAKDLAEKEPPFWDAYFADAIGKLEKSLGKIRENRLLATLTPEKRLLELRLDVSRGQRTRNFLDSPFWKEDLEPFLRKEARLKPWVPGDPLPLEEVSTLHLWNSGKVYILGVVLKQFEKWVEAGDAAAKTLADDAKKKEVLTRR